MGQIERFVQRARAVLAQDGPVPSPCSAVCTMHPVRGVCNGCWRTLGEIGAWASLNESGKRQVWRNIEARASADKA